VYFEPAWETIDYKDIQQSNGPGTKEEVSGFTVDMVDERHIDIPVRGAHKQFRDVFAFLTFLYTITAMNKSAQDRA
jgi:hypothetical protein